MTWTVEMHPAVKTWLLSDEIDQESYKSIIAAIRVLREGGPALRRPLVGEITTSRHKNMKELRPPSVGKSEVRILFAFDPTRRALLLVAGDKSGQWDAWYREHIPVADRRFDERLAEIEATKPQKKTGRRKRHG